MPFNTETNLVERIWRFVNQFGTGAAITRAGLDVALDDIVAGVNDADARIEALIEAIPNTTLYLGAKASPPTLNNDGEALVDGNTYIRVLEGEPTALYVRSAGAWVPVTANVIASPLAREIMVMEAVGEIRARLGLKSAALSASGAFATAAQGAKADAALPAAGITAFFKGLFNSANASEIRDRIGLKSAAVQPSSAFATAAQGEKADTALQQHAPLFSYDGALAQAVSAEHGLDEVHKLRVFIECLTAENGWDVGDRVEMHSFEGEVDRAMVLWSSATHVGFAYSGALILASKAGGAQAVATPENWRLHLHAW